MKWLSIDKQWTLKSLASCTDDVVLIAVVEEERLEMDVSGLFSWTELQIFPLHILLPMAILASHQTDSDSVSLKSSHKMLINLEEEVEVTSGCKI